MLVPREYVSVAVVLRRSREMTLLCSPKTTQHHPSEDAAVASRKGDHSMSKIGVRMGCRIPVIAHFTVR